MPQINVERIVTFTSEDSTHTTSNILSKDTSKKWKCKTPGEKSASIVLQLDQPYVINAIDIGNENSAYIEVLVSRSSAPEDFKVLLVMSSFMTPLEARQSQNTNKVRMFKYDDLSEPERNEKWDRIKIVCTQPFNKHVQYGLSFINLFYAEAKKNETPQRTSIGKFALRPESPDSISAGSLFARRKQTQEQTLKGAAAIREATSLAHAGSPAPKQKMKLKLPATPNVTHIHKNSSDDDSSTPKERKERNRNELLYSKDEEDKHEKIDRLIEKRDVEKAESNRKQNEKRLKEIKTAPKSTNACKDNQTPKESLKRKLKAEPIKNSKKTKKDLTGKPFERLLEGVVLVISGIQNPDRASLRSMALSMGAKYKPDWDNTCTHLVCAFANTPKFNQVKGKGKIVKRTWIEDCYNERKKLPWRRYALDKADQGPESEEEICEKDDTPSPEPAESKIDSINDDNDEDDTKEQGSDTDEKIAEIMKKQDDIYSLDTDDESNDDRTHTSTEIKQKLENFFEDKIFYVDEHFDADMEKKIKQYIVAYNGILVENLEDSIDIIVTNSENCHVLKDIYPSATCIAPDWIWECHNCKKLVPMNDFVHI